MKILNLNYIKGLAVVMLLSVAGSVSASALFQSGQKGLPDIVSEELQVNYDGSTGHFNVLGALQHNYADISGGNTVFDGGFVLDFFIDAAGVVDGAQASSFLITDEFNDLGFGLNADVLAGTVVDFGFTNTTFEMLLNITSGALAADFGVSPGVIVLGDFSSFLLGDDFASVGTNIKSDTFKVNEVPEPSVLVLMAMAGFSLVRVRKQQG